MSQSGMRQPDCSHRVKRPNADRYLSCWEKALLKMGDKSRAFVSKVLEVATQNPDFLPRSFDLEELRKDVLLFEALYPLLLSMTQLQELLDDTCLAVGSVRAALR